MTLATVLIIIALACAICGVFGVTFSRFTNPRASSPNWIALTLAFWLASIVLPQLLR